jgi:ADP-heptose:LPS heptosyltransferase
MAYKYSLTTRVFTYIIEWAGFIFLSPLNWISSLFYHYPPKTRVTKILLVEPFQMGDVISLTVMLDPLKILFPESEIYLLIHQKNKEILSKDKRIKGIYTADFPFSDYDKKKLRIQRYWNLLITLWKLRKVSFSIGIDSRGDIRSQLALYLINCRERLGYTHYLGSNIRFLGLFLNKRIPGCPFEHRYEWNRYIMTGLGIPLENLFPIPFPAISIEPDTLPAYAEIVVHIGGGWIYKRWKTHKWIELINSIGRNNQLSIRVIAGPGEKQQLEDIKAATMNSNIGFHTTSLDELITLIAGCTLFIGLDSGPMNLASVMGKKIIALFGPGDSQMWFPYQPDSLFIHHKAFFPCNPCFQTNCVFASYNCMDSITPEEVLNLVRVHYPQL